MVKRVQVYYNIRRGDYSVRQSGRVIDHVKQIVLRDVRFNVAPAGRDKVRATGVKNVHATVTGKICFTGKNSDGFGSSNDVYDFGSHKFELCRHISYNPFKYDSFVEITARAYNGFDATPVHSADYVALMPNREMRARGVK